MTAKKTFQRLLKNRRVQWLITAALVLLLIYIVFDWIVMPLYTRQGSERPVPNLVGLSRIDAVRRADSAGFAVVEQTAKMGGNVPEGTILEQHPFAGSLAKPGRRIRVTPALAAARDVAPDVVGLELRDAQLRCKNVGLGCSESDVRYRFSERTPKGTVMAQEPAAGATVDPAGAVKLVVSLGPPPAHFYVPYLMERPLHEARVLLRDAGLRLGKIVRKDTDQYPVGTVIAQSIRSGQEVERDTAVDVVVAVRKGAD
jgi:beta-lactam-binding protein with PASTA domain